MSRFIETVLLDRATLAALKAGASSLPTGQWVRGLDGRKGQFIGADRGIVAVSWVNEGEDFHDRTQRFARAVWHRLHKHEPVAAVLHAPASVSLDRLKEHFRTTFQNAA
jgi:hypothetical protein